VCHISAVSGGRSPGNCFSKLGPKLFAITGEAVTSRSRSSPILMGWWSAQRNGYRGFMSGLGLCRQLGTHPIMALPPRKVSSGLVTKIIIPVLEPAGPADAAGAFIIFVASPEFLFLFLKWAPSWRFSTRPFVKLMGLCCLLLTRPKARVAIAIDIGIWAVRRLFCKGN
jgi:hypothetical protein